MEAWEQIAGAREFVEWFGRWPLFHDAELLRLNLNRRGTSSLSLYAFDGTADVDEKGFYKTINHVLVEFFFDQIQELHLQDFSPQNVVMSLSLSAEENGYRFNWSASWGISGSIKAERISMKFTPLDGPPTDI